ncbi:MAG TPA: phosphoglucosamine mutase [Coriobacteriia bacterium]
MPRLFGTDGVRGIANADLSIELAARLGEAAATLLAGAGGTIVIGKDTRISGDMLEAAIVAGATSAGCDVLLAGIIPTPAVALLVRELGADAGVVISASHNPAEYNGIKFFDRDGAKLTDETEDRLEAMAGVGDRSARPTGGGVGAVRVLDDAVERYVAHAVATVPGRLDGLKVALDCGHGASARTSEAAFRALGADVVAINCDWDGTDINRESGSTHLGPLSALVASSGADLGIAHDGDADRTLAVDEKGGVVDGDGIMAICAARMHAEGVLGADTVVGTVMTNLGFDAAMREIGVRVVKAQVGDRYVLEEMRRLGANLGGEQSGHVIFLSHTTTGDGLITALQLAHAMAAAGRPLSELAGMVTPFPQVLVNVRVPEARRVAVDPDLLAAVAAEEASLGDTGRVLVRASGTEPLVRVMVEARDDEVARATAERLSALVTSIGSAS